MAVAPDMPGRTTIDLEPDEIVEAAVEIFHRQGLDAVSMRSVSAWLGVSPVPLYNRIGNKESLLNAMADHLLADVAPPRLSSEPWQDYALRWATALRERLSRSSDVRLLLGERREPYIEASRSLIDVLRAEGIDASAAVQACRLIVWATVGFVVVQTRRPAAEVQPSASGRPGGNPAGITDGEADHLFDLHLRYLLQGLERDIETRCNELGEAPSPKPRTAP